MNVLDLFSGIGGFSLGLERAGMRTVAFCEIDARCRQVLQKHWPHVPAYDDVCTLTGDRLRADGIAPDVICGGFPCQDISSAGKQAGIRGERSGLWSEYARIIGEVRPRYVIVENVSALLSGPSERPGEWFGVVLGDLAALGFDAEWHCIPASAVGARHRRDRVWIVANSDRGRRRADVTGRHDANGSDPRRSQADGLSRAVCPSSRAGYLANAVSDGQFAEVLPIRQGRQDQAPPLTDGNGAALADSDNGLHAGGLVGGGSDREARGSEGRNAGQGRPPHGQRVRVEPGSSSPVLANPERGGFQGGDVERAGAPAIIAAAIGRDCRGRELGETWRAEPNVGRVAYGVPDAMDRIAELGNAVIPQIPEIIGRAIMRTT